MLEARSAPPVSDIMTHLILLLILLLTVMLLSLLLLLPQMAVVVLVFALHVVWPFLLFVSLTDMTEILHFLMLLLHVLASSLPLLLLLESLELPLLKSFILIFPL